MPTVLNMSFQNVPPYFSNYFGYAAVQRKRFHAYIFFCLTFPNFILFGRHNAILTMIFWCISFFEKHPKFGFVTSQQVSKFRKKIVSLNSKSESMVFSMKWICYNGRLCQMSFFALWWIKITFWLEIGYALCTIAIIMRNKFR